MGNGHCSVAMAAAAVIEVKRQEACHGGSASNPDNLSIFWQAPQYAIVGLSEVFTSIGQMEFFYDQSPDVMRSCSMALGLLSSALGSYSAGILTWAVQEYSEKLTGVQWLPNDLNKGRLDLFFLFMMTLMLINVAIFLAVALSYEYKAVEHRTDVGVRVSCEDLLAAGPSIPTPILARSPSYMPIPGASGRRDEEEGEGEDEDEHLPNPEVYARSLAYQPPQPVRTQTFR